ncbi:hypothetical protein FAES_3212 [Fibrella aestuarina BUZ 2]|uniref:Uncharacterized protein n=1 Tax=Fibrella aestuarina BUZ 2 TaxID=1166018 RepID=I0KAR8_9BACT|nr:VRR-NUC domain-containing protein [Fibrella aestuarina]CCH01221.1 hypothetical protein FAES_3212 [Fibrella aestuarina BUZ 2]
MHADEYQAQFGGKPKKSKATKAGRQTGETLDAATFRAQHVDRFEHDIQARYFDWFYRNPKYRDFLLYAIPNGGERTIAAAQHLLDEGLYPGMCDVCLAVVTRRYPGLYMELKRLKGKAQANQLRVHAMLRKQGYRVEVPDTWEKAVAITEDYLSDYFTQ